MQAAFRVEQSAGAPGECWEDSADSAEDDSRKRQSERAAEDLTGASLRSGGACPEKLQRRVFGRPRFPPVPSGSSDLLCQNGHGLWTSLASSSLVSPWGGAQVFLTRCLRMLAAFGLGPPFANWAVVPPDLRQKTPEIVEFPRPAAASRSPRGTDGIHVVEHDCPVDVQPSWRRAQRKRHVWTNLRQNIHRRQFVEVARNHKGNVIPPVEVARPQS